MPSMTPNCRGVRPEGEDEVERQDRRDHLRRDVGEEAGRAEQDDLAADAARGPRSANGPRDPSCHAGRSSSSRSATTWARRPRTPVSRSPAFPAGPAARPPRPPPLGHADDRVAVEQPRIDLARRGQRRGPSHAGPHGRHARLGPTACTGSTSGARWTVQSTTPRREKSGATRASIAGEAVVDRDSSSSVGSGASASQYLRQVDEAQAVGVLCADHVRGLDDRGDRRRLADVHRVVGQQRLAVFSTRHTTPR